MYDVLALDKLRRPLRRRRGGGDGEGEEWSPDRHRTIDGDDVVELIPALADRRPSSGYLFYDCQTDDARLVLTVLAEAERFGAVFANRLAVTEVVADGVRARDDESGEELLIRADNVINATGVWADRVQAEELHDEAEVPVIRPSRGTHITLSPDDLPMHAGAIVPAGAGRTIFAVPWLGRTLVGTTDNDYEGDIDHVPPGRGRHRLPARRHQRVLSPRPRGGRPDRRLRGRAAAGLAAATARSRSTSRARPSSTRPRAA